MQKQLQRNRSPNEIADTDEYNQLQIHRMTTSLRPFHLDSPDRPLRVLVVDDHHAAADTLAMLVRAWGYDARVAYDGDQGLALAAEFVPDVLILDLVMPNMSGSLLALKAGQLTQLRDCVMIAVTGSIDELQRQFCQFVGISAVLVKPALPSAMQMLLASESDRLKQSRLVAATTSTFGRRRKRAGVRPSSVAALSSGNVQGTLVS